MSRGWSPTRSTSTTKASWSTRAVDRGDRRRDGAAEIGIPDLTERHWLVVRFMREGYLPTGTGPTIRVLGKASGVPVKELYELFPQAGEAGRQDRRHPQAARLHLRRTDMTELLAHAAGARPPKTLDKVTIVISKGSLEASTPA